mmetsp:Transcript_1421/g.3154  ORF Transcript_1421/g.3154 Transcript_1421/m.3154 type:complete len:341 (+) Transcript_1421:282-1304(+)
MTDSDLARHSFDRILEVEVSTQVLAHVFLVSPERAPVRDGADICHLQDVVLGEAAADQDGTEAEASCHRIDDARAQPSLPQGEHDYQGRQTTADGHAQIVGNAHAGISDGHGEVLNCEVVDQAAEDSGKDGVTATEGQDSGDQLGRTAVNGNPQGQEGQDHETEADEDHEAQAVLVCQPTDGHGQCEVEESGNQVHHHAITRSHAALGQEGLNPDTAAVGHDSVGSHHTEGHQHVGPIADKQGLQLLARSLALAIHLQALLLTLQEHGRFGDVATADDGNATRNDRQDERDSPSPSLNTFGTKPHLHQVCDELRSQETCSCSDVDQGNTSAQNFRRSDFG